VSGSAEFQIARARALSNERLHLIVLPTEKCNFRCVYCYEDFAIGRMNASVQEGILNLLRQRIERLKYLEIGWFGGEPLLAKDIIYRINRFALSNRGDCSFLSTISTNASLLELSTFRELVRHGVQLFQVTIDGAKELHDQTRITRNGQGTFCRIMENLEGIRASEVACTIVVRTHVSENNVSSLSNLILYFAKLWRGDHRFKIHLKPVEALGSANDPHFPFLRNKEALRQIRELAIHSGLELAKSASSMCYAAAANSFVIRADGRIAKCTVAFNDDRNCIGALTADGDMIIHAEKLRPWIGGVLADRQQDTYCPLHSL
jgi:uncharacterized protein